MEGRSKNIGIALTVVWFVLIGTVEAGPPFVTDDPEVPPVGGWEINIPFTLNRTPGSTQMNAPLFDFNYGLPQLQLEFDIPVAVSSDRKATNVCMGIADKIAAAGENEVQAVTQFQGAADVEGEVGPAIRDGCRIAEKFHSKA